MLQTPKPHAKKPVESAKAEDAFADFVGLGHGRSLTKLAELRVSQKLAKNTASALVQLKKWSTQHNWQTRLVDAATARSTAMLEQAAELDADTFLVTSRLINERINYSHPGDTDVVIKMRESVRKPMPRGGTSVNVNVSVEVQRVVDQIAEDGGLTEDEKRELLARVSRRVAESR